MGWLEMSRTAMGGHETPKAYLDAQFTYEREVDGAKRGHKVLASSCVNNRVWYGAVQQVENGVPGEVFAVVCLVKWNPRSRSGYHFAYKDSAPLWR